MAIRVFTIIIIPIIIAFVSVIVCIFEAIHQKNILIEEYCQNLFATQVNASSMHSQDISYRLSKEIYKIPFYLNVINSFYDKIIQGKAKYNPAHQSSILNYFLVQANLEKQPLTQLAIKNPFLFDIQPQQDQVSLQNLDSQKKTIILNSFLGSALIRAILHISRECQNDCKLDQIPYQSIFSGSNYQGLFFKTLQNYSFLGLNNLNNLDENPDLRKRLWYQNSLNQTSFYMNEPNLPFGKDESVLSQSGCQKLMYFNNDTQKVEVYHVLCINTLIKKLSTYFQNVIKLSKQYYLIDPRTLAIIYNSNHEQNLTSASQLDNFYNLELEFLEDKQQSNYFQDLIANKYQNLIFNTSNNTKTTLKQMVELDQYQFTFDYKRNSSTYKVILNPVISYHDIPEFITRYSGQTGQYLQQIYLQINMISDEDFRIKENSFLAQTSGVLFIVSVVCIVLISLLFVGAIIQYLLLVKRQVYDPIDKLTQILQRISFVQKHQNINETINEFHQNEDDIFLSQETKNLYNSFYDLFQNLQYLNEHFFTDNEGQTLIDLNNKVNFFKKFNNYYALGIAHNNIGSILLNQKHYFQSLEHFNSSIICSKYEIKEFCERTGNLFFKKALEPYSYIDPYQQNFNKAKISIYKREISFSVRSQNKQKYSDVSNGNQMNQFSPQTRQIRTKQYKNNQIIRENTSISESQKRIVRTKNSIFTKNMIFFANEQNEDEQFEEFQQIIQSLLYRKINKINALIEFQQELENDKREKNFYNFWQQIKQLSKELIKLSSHLNSQGNVNLIYEFLQFKCYYRMYNFSKAEQTFQKAKQIILNNQALLKAKKELNLTTSKYQSNNQKLQAQTNRLSNQISNLQNTNKENTLDVVTNSAYYQSCHNLNYLDQINLDFTNQMFNQKNNIDKNKKKIQGMKILKQDYKINEIFIKEKQQQNKPPSLLNIPLFIQYEIMQFNYAKYLIFTKQYKKAAFILTEILEKSKYLTSNIPYRIFFLMKQIFDLFKIQDQSITEQQERFNKNKIFQIVISFEIQKPIQNIQKRQSHFQNNNKNDENSENKTFSFNQILLFKNLIDQILVKSNDQISISFNNLSKESVQQFMPLIQMSNFKHQKSQILNQIKKSIFQNQNLKESFNSELQHYLLENKISTQINNNFHLQSSFDFNESELSFESSASYYKSTKEKIQLNSTLYSNNFYFMTINNQMNLQKQLNQTELNHKIRMNSYVLHNQQNQQMKEYFSSSYHLNSKQNVNQNSINSLDQLSISLHQDLNMENNQEQNNTSDIQNGILIERNTTFHYFIRSALKQLISKQINYKLTENKLNIKKQQISHSFYKQFRESSLQQDQKMVDQLNEKIIIYQTEEICIIKNNLFMSLCQLLSQFKIQIIIFASKRGNSFIDKLENETFMFNNKEVIKAFYSAKKIVQYLFSKRDQFDKQAYWSFIQHY